MDFPKLKKQLEAKIPGYLIERFDENFITMRKWEKNTKESEEAFSFTIERQGEEIILKQRENVRYSDFSGANARELARVKEDTPMDDLIEEIAAHVAMLRFGM